MYNFDSKTHRIRKNSSSKPLFYHSAHIQRHGETKKKTTIETNCMAGVGCAYSNTMPDLKSYFIHTASFVYFCVDLWNTRICFAWIIHTNRNNMICAYTFSIVAFQFNKMLICYKEQWWSLISRFEFPQNEIKRKIESKKKSRKKKLNGMCILGIEWKKKHHLYVMTEYATQSNEEQNKTIASNIIWR